MKKIISLSLVGLLCAFVLSSCQSNIDFGDEDIPLIQNGSEATRTNPSPAKLLVLRECDPDAEAVGGQPPSTIYYSFNSVDTLYRVDLLVNTNHCFRFNTSAVVYINPVNNTFGILSIKTHLENPDEFDYCRVIDYSISASSFTGNSLKYTVGLSYAVPSLDGSPRQSLYNVNNKFIFER